MKAWYLAGRMASANGRATHLLAVSSQMRYTIVAFVTHS
jgi:hypothetical protein